MGYSHSWDRPRNISSSTFHQITTDFTRLLPALQREGVELTNPLGYDEPEITPEHVGFNGAVLCGHARNQHIVLPGPTPEARGVGPNTGLRGGSLPFRTCNGDCSYESFLFSRDVPEEQTEGEQAYGIVKTAFRPYDLAVTAFLVIAAHHLGPGIKIRTDGDTPQWQDARQLCQEELGYSLDCTVEGDRVVFAREAVPCA